MEKEQLRREYLSLLDPRDLQTLKSAYELITDSALFIIESDKQKESESVESNDGKTLFELSSLKNLSLLKLIESFSYKNEISNTELNSLLDPFTINTIVRTQYEAFCNFNNIYVQSKSFGELVLKHKIWTICGLLYRQTLPAKNEVNVKKKEVEQMEIEKLRDEIEISALFLSLNDKSKMEIMEKIKRKNWQLIFSGQNVAYIGWHQMFKNAGVKNLLNGQYTFLSLHTHPSYVSLFQYKDMKENDRSLEKSIFSMKFSMWLISFFIADYCYYYKETKK